MYIDLGFCYIVYTLNYICMYTNNQHSRLKYALVRGCIMWQFQLQPGLKYRAWHNPASLVSVTGNEASCNPLHSSGLKSLQLVSCGLKPEAGQLAININRS